MQESAKFFQGHVSSKCYNWGQGFSNDWKIYHITTLPDLTKGKIFPLHRLAMWVVLRGFNLKWHQWIFSLWLSSEHTSDVNWVCACVCVCACLDGGVPVTTCILLTFHQSMQHCLACPACVHSPEDWEERTGPLRGRESSLQWKVPSTLLHRTTANKSMAQWLLVTPQDAT